MFVDAFCLCIAVVHVRAEGALVNVDLALLARESARAGADARGGAGGTVGASGQTGSWEKNH
jgi:hypothetical protein